jgi:predicted N-acetyltransferase YhbS
LNLPVRFGYHKPFKSQPDQEPNIETSRFTLRPATAADQPAIEALLHSASVHTRNKHTAAPAGEKRRGRGWVSKCLSALYASHKNWRDFVVALDTDGEIIGCARIKECRNGIRELASIAVARNWRGSGVAFDGGRFILSQFEPPIWGICLGTHVSFYRRFGARQVTEAGEMPPFLRRRLGRINLMLRLMRRRSGLAVMVYEGGRV